MQSEIAKCQKRLKALSSERSTFIPYYRELSDYHLGHRGRFLSSDRNKGYKRNTKQINNTSRLAVRTISSGMMAGITSPARPWFRLSIADLELREYGPVKEWLAQVEAKMYRVFSASNIYNALHTLYGELAVFGTGVMGIFDDFDNVIHCRPYTVGSYMLALNGKNEVDTFYREYEISVAQCVKQFGIENCSRTVQERWKSGGSETWVKIVHIIEPNDNRDNMSPLARDKKFRSIYYEADHAGNADSKFLRRSGFDHFPILAPRWDVTAEDVYGTDCPGMTSLGDTKALQLGERRKYQALDRLIDPPLQGPSALSSKVGKSLRNGEIVFHDMNGQGLTSIYTNFRPDLGAMVSINQETETRIKRAFYEDLFLMLANSDRRQITAREVQEKHEEKLLMLGPVLERLHSELLDPLINITFEKLSNAGVLPPPPQELAGRELEVEYISVLAQAQRMVAVGGLDQMAQYVGGMTQVWPEARHKFDALQAIDEYAEALGVAPKVIRPDEEVQQILAGEQQQQQQAEMAAQVDQVANTAKTLSESKMTEDSALQNMLKNAGLQG